MPLPSLGSGWATRCERLAARLLGDDDTLLAGRVERALPALCQYLDLLVAWNSRLDLTAARSADELVDLTLADALVIAAPPFGDSGRAVDVGSGAGAPALPLALMCPQVDFTLVEPKSKRVAFLRTALGALKLDNAQVVRARSLDLPARGHQTALSRATLPPALWLAEAARLATRQIYVLVARAERPEVAGWQIASESVYRWPLTGVERRVLRYAPNRAAD